MATPIQEHLSPDNAKQIPATSTAQESGSAPNPSRLDSTIPVRVKVVDPLLTTGPSSPACLLRAWDTGMTLKVHCAIFRGSLVQVRTNDKILLGRARLCLPSGTEFEVSIEIVETL
jgi:hypothetical protein